MSPESINIADVIAGRNEAWKDVYECFWQKLVYYCIRINPEIIQLDAEEIVQEAFMRVYKHRHRIESIKHLNNSLYLSVKNIGIQIHRHEVVMRQSERGFHYSFEKDEDLVNQEMDFDKVIAELLDYISKLPEEVQQAIWARVKTRKNTVQQSNVHYLLVCRARKKIREYFKLNNLYIAR